MVGGRRQPPRQLDLACRLWPLAHAAERVARALATLPDRYEAVLRAKYLEGRSVQDIASAWDETPKAVESLLTRARQAFRKAYEKSERTHD